MIQLHGDPVAYFLAREKVSKKHVGPVATYCATVRLSV